MRRAQFYHELFNGKFRFVHVVRDGRDVALGDNQMQHSGLCKFVNGSHHNRTFKSSCGREGHRTAARVNFWARVNEDAYTFGTTVLGPSRYFLLRTEDLVLRDSAPLIKRLAKFLNLREPSATQLAALERLYAGHRGSYGGAKYTEEQQAQHLAEIGDAGRSAFETFGYRADRWGLRLEAPIVDGMPPG